MFFKKILFLVVFSLWQAAFADEAASTQEAPETAKPHPQANESTKVQPINTGVAGGSSNATSNEPNPSQRIPLHIFCRDHVC